jgi:hypothetical protein
MDDLRSRLANRVQLTTNGHRAYLEAVEGAFGGDVDYAVLQKLYGTAPEAAKGRYSPAVCTGTRRERIEADPASEHVSTSYVERQNLNADVHAALHQAHERFLKEGREPLPRAGAVLRLVQFLPAAQDASRQPGHGRWRCRSAVEHGGHRGAGRGCRAEARTAGSIQKDSEMKLPWRTILNTFLERQNSFDVHPITS